MKLKITWLETVLSRWGVVANEPSNPESVKPVDNESDGEVASSTRDQDPEKNAPMPDIYSDELSETVPDLRFLDQPSPGADESVGFDPYDTAKMQKK